MGSWSWTILKKDAQDSKNLLGPISVESIMVIKDNR